MPQTDSGSEKPIKPKEGEVIPPTKDPEGSQPAIYADIYAQLNHYTDRPDLLLEAIEKHDPGFIKKMNEESADFSRKNREARFSFGRIQAYVTLGVAVLAAISIVYCLYLLIDSKQAGFWSILGIAVFYAVTQGGAKGFLSIIDGVKKIISGKDKLDGPS